MPPRSRAGQHGYDRGRPFTAANKADNELDIVLATAMDAREQTEQRLAQDLTVAESQITAAKNYINTRRGAVNARALRIAQGDAHSQRDRPDVGSQGASSHRVRRNRPLQLPRFHG
ncbi:hypothetical protein ACGFIU_22225 [Rhodococcus oryzae]|uniref:hypothetical protein n=1 Tax=Rhodococcus oryzae TaxID=2571143 RepID=UPI003710F750